MKKRLISLLLALSAALSLLCTAAFAAESTGVGITPVTNPDLWTTRLNSQGQSYSYTVTAEDEELPGIKVIKTSATDGTPIENAVYSIKGVTCSFSTSVSTGPDGTALVEDLPAGVFIVKEEFVPEPFVRTASEQTIALRPGKISEARFEDYLDPPYHATEGYYQNIGEDGFTETDHIRLRDALMRIEGKFLLSYNDDEFIRSLYDRPGIYLMETTRINNIKQRYDNGAQFPELIIANYDMHERLRVAPSQMNLFDLTGGDTAWLKS